MKGSIYTADVFGNTIEVQCKITKGLPSVQIIGLASKALDEAKERVRAAFHSSNLEFPKGRVLVNLSPADIPKEGSSYDLPIALAILQASGVVRAFSTHVFAVGELSLNGSIEPIGGIIGRLRANVMPSIGAVIVPAKNELLARHATTTAIVPVHSLREIVDIISGASSPKRGSQAPSTKTNEADTSYNEVKGQLLAKRALQIAAAGRHNVLLLGPPGTGKSMLAKALTSLLPDLGIDEQLATTHLHSLRNHRTEELIVRPPLRSPHHSSSAVALLGGGQKARPGEVTLAHNGVLFLDELLEFPRNVIEALRQPLEDRIINIARAEHSVSYPASFLMIATMNPCPCGYLGSKKPCTCTAYAIDQYQKKLSGPLADRIDLFVSVEEIAPETLLEAPKENNIESVRGSISKAHKLQNERNSGKYNSELTNKDLRSLKIDAEARTLLDVAAEKMNLSPRAYFRVIRTARTIADLEQLDTITKEVLAESLQFRLNIPRAE